MNLSMGERRSYFINSSVKRFTSGDTFGVNTSIPSDWRISSNLPQCLFTVGSFGTFCAILIKHKYHDVAVRFDSEWFQVKIARINHFLLEPTTMWFEEWPNLFGGFDHFWPIPSAHTFPRSNMKTSRIPHWVISFCWCCDEFLIFWISFHRTIICRTMSRG